MGKPYYEHSGITIYHGDAREIVPTLGEVGCILGDPPYGIDYGSGGDSPGGKWNFVRHHGVRVRGDDVPFDPTFLLTLNVPMILWGANFYSEKLPPAGWLVWDKRPGIEDMKFGRGDAELAFFSGSRTVKTFRHLWHGLCRGSEVGRHLHPTQKPIELMQWCLGLLPLEGVVLDPFVGSGPVLVAAKNLSRRAIGIEIEERYCEIAAERLSQEVLDFARVPSEDPGHHDA